MTQVVLFHHVPGLTDGVREFADRLRAGGHDVNTPDLFDGRTAATVEEGFALMKDIGDEVIEQRLARAIADLPDQIVYAGIAHGVSTAQRLAQTRPAARGALLYEACFPISGESPFGPWPEGLPVQVHGMERDPFFGLEAGGDVAREPVETAGGDVAELFVYPGDQHLFTDSSLPSYDGAATAQVVERPRAFLDRLD